MTDKRGRGSVAMLEPNERIKARRGGSSDCADAVALAMAGTRGRSASGGK